MKETMRAKVLVAAIFTTCAVCTPAADSPEWTITVKVVDEQQLPVRDATVKVAWYVPPPEGQSVALTNMTGLTDINGLLIAHERSGSMSVMCGVAKAGYYPAERTHEFANFRADDPDKLNPVVPLLLKKIEKPIPMYAKLVESGPPVLNKPIGYDLTMGDWVAPYGKGQTTDILFEKQYHENAPNDYYSKIIVSFPNKGDGIQVANLTGSDSSSSFRSLYEAPEDGYQPGMTRETSSTPGQTSKLEFEPNRIYFLRVESTMDKNGGLKSALYGKIYGDFMQFRYYLNPTANDRDIEFDPAHNLSNLRPREPKITAP